MKFSKRNRNINSDYVPQEIKVVFSEITTKFQLEQVCPGVTFSGKNKSVFYKEDNEFINNFCKNTGYKFKSS